MAFDIITYKPEFQPVFEKLNLQWLNMYFHVEPIDKKVLSQPEQYIIADGGAIYFVSNNGNLIGTAALKVHNVNELELTKMAVDPASQGLGAGKYLCSKMIEKATEMGYEKLILYSNTKLKPAINIYRQLGFKEIPLEAGIYQRADIKMEILLDKNIKN